MIVVCHLSVVYSLWRGCDGVLFFVQAEDGIRYLVRSRGLGDVYKRQDQLECGIVGINEGALAAESAPFGGVKESGYGREGCLLYTSDAADERSSVDLGGRRIIKKKKSRNHGCGRDKPL